MAEKQLRALDIDEPHKASKSEFSQVGRVRMKNYYLLKKLLPDLIPYLKQINGKEKGK